MVNKPEKNNFSILRTNYLKKKLRKQSHSIKKNKIFKNKKT